MNKPNVPSSGSRRTIQEPSPATTDTSVHPHRTIVELSSTDASAGTSNPGQTVGLPAAAMTPTAHAGSAPTRALAGAELGTYRLVELLGEGGMGAVWKAIHTKLKKAVAVKVLPAQLTRDPGVVARFEREMEAVGKLDHPNIVRAMDAGEINGTYFLVMEYVDGLNLGDLVEKRGKRSVKEACEMIRQAAVGLSHAHQHKLVHRDIKPGNLLLSKQGKVKILDLGLARLQGEAPGSSGKALTGFGMIMGTPDFMAPEQWEDLHAADHRADLYALGCTFFYLLTGHAPFDDAAHQSLAKKLAAHTAESPPDLTKERPDVSPELNAVYRKLLAKDPNDRFASAADLARALQAAAKGQPVPGVGPAPAPGASQPPSGIAAASAKPSAGPVSLAVDAGLESVLAAIANDAAPASAMPQRSKTRKAVAEDTESKSSGGLDKRKLGIAGAALAGVLLLGGIVIKITTKDGKTAEIKVPEGAKVEIATEGEIKVSPTEPGEPQAGDVERRALEWILSVDGGAQIDPGGSIGPGGRIPDGNFVITQINLAQKPRATDLGMAKLKGLKSVAALSLYGNGQLGDAALEAISGMTALEDLNMQSLRISDEGLKHLARMTKLQKLNLTSTPITGTGFAHLVGLTELNNLRLAECPLDNAAMAHLKYFPKLAAIEIRNPQFDDEGLKWVGSLPELADVGLAFTQVTSAGLAHLSQMPKLKSLGIWRGPVDDAGLKHLAGIKSLQGLGLSELNLTGEGFKDFPADRLTSLSFWRVRLNDAGLKEIARFEKLEKLSIESCAASDAGFAGLAALKNLKELKLAGDKIGDETAAALRKALPNTRIDGLPGSAAPTTTATSAVPAALDGIELDPVVPLGTLQIGTDLPNTSQHHLITELPDAYRGATYTAPDGIAGRLKFKVTKPMTVRVAFWDSQWGGVGNAEGNWRPELKNQDDLAKDGWKEVARFKTNYAAEKIDYGWIIYERACKAGESFLLRNGKYRAPILVVTNSVSAPVAASPGSIAHPGLIGRIQIDGKDAKILATYNPGKPFGHKNLKTIFPAYDYGRQKIAIDLSGVLELAAAEKVRIRHAGGSTSGGVATLFVDGKPLGKVGDEHEKDVTYEPELAKGTHAVRWVLEGGWLGSANVIEVAGADGREIPVGHTDANLAAASKDETKKSAELTGEAARAYSYAPAKPPQFSWKVAAERPAVLRNTNLLPVPLDPAADNTWFPTAPDKLTDSDAVVYSGGNPTNTFTADVETDGFLFVGVNHEYQGNSSGGWEATRWMPEQFVAAGWAPLSERDVGGKLITAEKREQKIYVKFVRKGEKLKLQCNKYNPPYVIHFELPAAATSN